jgi:1-deoxy-D-xylulose-5-phosphate synthase
MVDNGVTQSRKSNRPMFTESFAGALLSLGVRDNRIVAITAAMEDGTGLAAFRKAFPKRFFDVGIAEEHAITFAAGLASGGLKPVAAIYSTFIQRSADQIIHDAALQKLPVIIALDRSGFVSEDGETHQGLFDIALFRCAPNITIFAPAGESELKLMMEWALNQAQGPVIIRYPKARCPEEIPAFSQPLETGRGTWINLPSPKVERSSNRHVCLAFTGSLYREIINAAELLAQWGIEADLYNLRFLKPIDEDYLVNIMNSYELVVFIEEGIQDGGFGEYASSLAGQRNCLGSVGVLAVSGGFVEKNRSLGTREELLSNNGLDGKSIAWQVQARYLSRAKNEQLLKMLK